jgi:hypothetical protein
MSANQHFQNGNQMQTEIITKSESKIDYTNMTVSQYTAAFKSSMRKTAEAVLEMARVAYEAENNLTRQAYAQFCKQIGFKTEDSTLSKLKSIGAKYEILKKNEDKLPPNWTSIYKIAQATSDVVQGLIDGNKISPTTTGAELNTLLGIEAKNKKASHTSTAAIQANTQFSNNEYTIVCKLYSAPTPAQLKILKEMKEMLKNEQIACEKSPSLEPFFE